MKTLATVIPTAEQLPIISNPQAGVTLIRGAAGSGKTTTALLMLRQLSEFWVRHRERLGNFDPVRVLVLTYNRTLQGYISHLAKQQSPSSLQANIDVTTFGKWARKLVPYPGMIDYETHKHIILTHGSALGLSEDFLLDEVDYCLGRFLSEDRDSYLTAKRIGRGITPRMEKPLRERLLNDVVVPYDDYKETKGLQDWNDLALKLIATPQDCRYDIIIADETQDFSANQIRAVISHASELCTKVFVLDAAQRIYPRGWTWKDVGILINPNRSFRLQDNHRNTKEICRLAKPLLDGLDLSDDGTIPNLESCTRSGSVPTIIKGRFSAQCSHAISSIINTIDLTQDSVAFVHPKAGRWFDYIRQELHKSDLDFVELAKRSDWPEGSENIALISMHSIKGLEFDHIFILGFDKYTTPHGNEDGDTAWENLRRLLAMTITRARQTVTIGCKPKEASSLIGCLDPESYQSINL
ncbi:MAG: 3'-5' exonuclease [Desulfocapsaceae bacterium]|nr:3'-5' exonuclease [Desulfocapsaceae bacterium]